MKYISPSQIKPDCKEMDLSVPVYQYFYRKHNINSLDMPSKRIRPLAGITIHNTDTLDTADDCKNYIAATVNGNLGTVRVQYYVSPVSIYHGLEDDYINWSCGDGGNGLGNATTIAIEIIMNNTTSASNTKSMDNGARLAAYLLHKYNMNVEDNLFTHTYWLNVMMGKTGDKDTMCTVAPLKSDGKTYHKTCPYYIIKGKGWKHFKTLVQKYLDELNNKVNPPKEETSQAKLYRVRKSAVDSKTQIGAYSSLDSAKALAEMNYPYKVFDANNKLVYVPTQYYEKYVIATKAPVKFSPETKAKTQTYFPVGKKINVYYGTEVTAENGTIWMKFTSPECTVFPDKSAWIPLKYLRKDV